jgi:broad specificity phosphatase PhoE
MLPRGAAVYDIAPPPWGGSASVPDVGFGVPQPLGEDALTVYFVRHGETDYDVVASRGVRGWATSFAPLSALGRLQIDTIARDYRLQDAEAILCSSYARALESGALLSRALNKPLFVEYDLHEWLPQKDPLGDIDSDLLRRAQDGLGPSGDDEPWEGVDEVRARVRGVLERYRGRTSVIVVSHAVVIQSVTGLRRVIDHAEIVPYELPSATAPVRASDADRPALGASVRDAVAEFDR